MKKFLWLVLLISMVLDLHAQSFEIGAVQEVYRGHIGETVKIPLKLTNRSDKPLTLIVRRVSSNLGGTQKDYFCPGGNCLDQQAHDVSVVLEPGQTLDDFQIALEAGLADIISSARYVVLNRYNPTESVEFDLNFAVSERSARESVFSNPHITLHEIYPNPIVDHAFVNYEITNEDIEARIIIHNILGNPIEECNLPASENKVKIKAESMSAGIYFYTLYLDGEGVITRKLIVKK